RNRRRPQGPGRRGAAPAGPHPRRRVPRADHPEGCRMTTLTARPALALFIEERVFALRALRHSLRDVESLVLTIVLPVMLMLLFTFVFGGAFDPSGRYVDYVVPGIILLCAGFGAAGTAVSVSQD